MSDQSEVGVLGSEASASVSHEAGAHPVEVNYPSSMERRVLNLAWPVIGENFLETLLGIVDTWLVSSLGAIALAGVGTAIQFMFGSIWIARSRGG
jgi:Na+-driven multidrug efflux pump